jgi:hypothetical protein
VLLRAADFSPNDNSLETLIQDRKETSKRQLEEQETFWEQKFKEKQAEFERLQKSYEVKFKTQETTLQQLEQQVQQQHMNKGTFCESAVGDLY